MKHTLECYFSEKRLFFLCWKCEEPLGRSVVQNTTSLKAGMTSLEKIFPFLQILFVAVAAGQDGDRDGDNSGRDGVVTTICQP